MITYIVYTLLVHPELQTDNGVSHLEVPHYRFQNNNDVVCKVPFWMMGYRHHGTNVYMNYKGKVVKYRWWRRMIDNLRGRLRALIQVSTIRWYL